ncbi:MAG: enoyl-CoA hydratase-related protein [Planctomycetota bacterium]|jgi:2-(1,2-epoxy-1,2-dihydrophenyl)acetyl-CoA isomerase
MAENHVVTVDDEGGVRTITLNRPDVLNAFNEPLADALTEAVRAAGEDKAVRCVVVTGAGRGFCSGQDLGELLDRARAGNPLELRPRILESYNPVIAALRTIEKPVVASVNGVAAGAGFSLALACDLRIAAESASFIQAFINVGLVPDCASTFMLPRLVGVARAMELTFTGRKVPAREAFEMGLVNQVVPAADLRAETMKLAGKLASMPTRAIGLTKRAINAAWAADLDTQLEYEAELQAIAQKTDDHAEGITAFIEKRPAVFKGG